MTQMTQKEIRHKAEVKAAKLQGLRQDLTEKERDDFSKEVNRLLKQSIEIDNEREIKEALSDLPPAAPDAGPYGRQVSGMGLQQAYLSKGWDIQSRPSVNLGAVFGQKAMMADGSDAEVSNLPGISSIGQDARFAYPAFPATSLGDVTSVSFLQQTVRTFSPSAMDVSLTGSTTKSESVLTSALAAQDALMIAHTTELVPNAIWNLPKFQKWISKEMSYGLGLGIDFELLRALAAASGTTTQTQGTDTAFQCYRNAIKTHRTAGYNPNLAILHPNDAAALDLAADGNDRFYGAGPTGQTGFPSLWGLRVVESISATAGSPILVDTAAYGELFFGALKWAVNPYEEFRTNRSRGLLEVPMCVVIEQPAAIVEITLA